MGIAVDSTPNIADRLLQEETGSINFPFCMPSRSLTTLKYAINGQGLLFAAKANLR
jgi:hypothetical protein